MREIILDTETTGLKDFDRLIEIGCIELWNYVPTGRVYHTYLNPEIPISQEASQIHGLTLDILRDKPLFQHVLEDFLGFISFSPLVIHNAAFDIKFLNRELKNLGRDCLSNPTVDTFLLAKKKFPGSPASLDALCNRFKVDRSKREKHGALIDCELLAQVYIELRGGRQQGLVLDNNSDNLNQDFDLVKYVKEKKFKPSRGFSIDKGEKEANEAFLTRVIHLSLNE